jgi:hypothetical protein
LSDIQDEGLTLVTTRQRNHGISGGLSRCEALEALGEAASSRLGVEHRGIDDGQFAGPRSAGASPSNSDRRRYPGGGKWALYQRWWFGSFPENMPNDFFLENVNTSEEQLHWFR